MSKTYRVTATKAEWKQVDKALQGEQKTKEKRRDLIAAQNYGTLRGEIDACINGHDIQDDVSIIIAPGEIALLRRHLKALGIVAKWGVA